MQTQSGRDSSANARARANWLRAFEAARRHRDSVAAQAAAATTATAEAAAAACPRWRHVRVAALVHRADGLAAVVGGGGRAFVKAHIVRNGARAKATRATSTQRLASGLAEAAMAAAFAASPRLPSAAADAGGGKSSCSWQEMLTVEALLPLESTLPDPLAAAETDDASARRALAAAARAQGLSIALRVKAPRPFFADAVLGEALVPLAEVIERPAAWSVPCWLPLLSLRPPPGEGQQQQQGQQQQRSPAAAPAGTPPSSAPRIKVQLFLSRALPAALRVLCATWNVGNAAPPPPHELRQHWFRLPPLRDGDDNANGDGKGDDNVNGDGKGDDTTGAGADQAAATTAGDSDEDRLLPHLVFIGAQECNFARESAKLLKKARSSWRVGGGGGEDEDEQGDHDVEQLRSGGVVGAGRGAVGGSAGVGGDWGGSAGSEGRGRGRGRRRRRDDDAAAAPSAVASRAPAASVFAAAAAVAALYAGGDVTSSDDGDDGDDDEEDEGGPSSDDDAADGAPGNWRARGASPAAGEASTRLAAAEAGDATRAAPLAKAGSGGSGGSRGGLAPTSARDQQRPGLGGAWETGDRRAPASPPGRPKLPPPQKSSPGGSLAPARSAPASLPSAFGGAVAGGGAGAGGGGFAAGLRAQVDSAREWEAACSAALGGRYFLVGARHMFQTRALLFARADVVPDVSRVRTGSEATGVGRVAPNKGGVAVAARVGATDIAFVNAHLAAHQSRLAARCADVAEICGLLLQRPDDGGGGGGRGSGSGSGGGGGNERDGSSTSPSSAAPRFWGGARSGAGAGVTGRNKRWWWLQPGGRPVGSSSPCPADAASAASASAAAAALLHRLPLGTPGADVCTGFDHAVFLGDLNFRVDYGALARDPKDTPDEEEWQAVAAAAARRDFAPLRERDQLLLARGAGRVFAGWGEAELRFPPTFKVAKGRAGERYARKRCPAWTDRVLLRSALPHLPARALDYWSAPSVATSDHKPVAALVEVPLAVRTVAAAASGYGRGGGDGTVACSSQLAGGGGTAAAAAAAAASAASAAAAAVAGAFAAAAAAAAGEPRVRSAPALSGRAAGAVGSRGLRAPSLVSLGGLLALRQRPPEEEEALSRRPTPPADDPEAVALSYRLVLSSAALREDGAATWAALLREAATADGDVAAAANGGGTSGGGGGGAAVSACAKPDVVVAFSDDHSRRDACWNLYARLELRGACLSPDQAAPSPRGLRGLGAAAGKPLLGALLRALGGGAGRPRPGQAVARTRGAVLLSRPAAVAADGDRPPPPLELLQAAAAAAATTTSGGGGVSGGGPSLSAALLPARLGDLEDERLVLCVVARRVDVCNAAPTAEPERVVARGVVPLRAAVQAARAQRLSLAKAGSRGGGGGGCGAAVVEVELERCGRRVGAVGIRLRLVEALKVDTLAASAVQRMAALIR